MLIQNIVVMILSVIMFLVIIMTRTRIKYLSHQLDDDVITPSDFTLHLKHLPKDKTQEEVREWLEKEYNLQIEEVNFSYDIGKLS